EGVSVGRGELSQRGGEFPQPGVDVGRTGRTCIGFCSAARVFGWLLAARIIFIATCGKCFESSWGYFATPTETAAQRQRPPEVLGDQDFCRFRPPSDTHLRPHATSAFTAPGPARHPGSLLRP